LAGASEQSNQSLEQEDGNRDSGVSHADRRTQIGNYLLGRLDVAYPSKIATELCEGDGTIKWKAEGGKAIAKSLLKWRQIVTSSDETSVRQRWAPT